MARKGKSMRKRVFKKRKIPRGVNTAVSASFKGTTFPKRLCTTLKYTQQISPSTAPFGTYVFSCNNLYDPDFTATGTQPLYFDQLMAIYDHYTVIGSKITYRIIPRGTTVQEPFRICSWINDDTTAASSDIDVISQQPGSKVRLCTGGLNPSQIIVSNKWSAKKYFGGSSLANTSLQGTAAAGPAEQSYYYLNLRTMDGVATTTMWVVVEISYVAVFSELKDMVGS